MTHPNIDEFTENERSFSAESEYAVPTDIQLDGGRLTWRDCFSASKLRWRKVRPETEMLNRFVQLADATDEEIRKYALRWGVLNLCKEHLLPSSHNPFCEALESPPDPQGEPVSEWRAIARIIQAILNIARKLSDNELAEWNNWKVLVEEEWVSNIRRLRDSKRDKNKLQEDLEFQRRKIAGIIDAWVRISALRPTVSWNGGRISIAFTGDSKSRLCGALVSQLLLVSGHSGLACCSECRTWYERDKRMPKKGQANYCPDCKAKGIPLRNAARAKRRREKNQGNEI